MDTAAAPHYRERLLPNWWVWPVALALPQPLAIAYGSAYGVALGLAIALFAAGAVAAGLWATAVTITVTDAGVSYGRALLPRWACGDVEVLDAARLQAARRDPSAFLGVRTWSGSGGVRIAVTDPHDPHSAWVLTSRTPQRLASALLHVPSA